MTRGDRLPVRVQRVRDGDSLFVRVLDTGAIIHVRLAFIDAPEIDQPHGLASRAYLRSLALGKNFTLVITDSSDHYGRVVGLLSEDAACPSINREMVAAGWAFYWELWGRSVRLRLAEEEAQSRNRGMWEHGDPGERPWDYRTRRYEESLPPWRRHHREALRARRAARSAPAPAKKTDILDVLGSLSGNTWGCLIAMVVLILLGIGILFTELCSSDLRYDPDGPDRNCWHFESQEEAQEFFIAAGGPYKDPHHLDRNRNKVACENWSYRQ